MRIQIITENSEVNKLKAETISVRNFTKPLSFADFDVVIIDLSYEGIWKHSGNNVVSLDKADDFRSLEVLAQNKKNCKVLYILPMNSTFYYHQYSPGYYSSHCKLKDIIISLQNSLLALILPYESSFPFDLVFEPTITKIGDNEYNCDFCFEEQNQSVLTYSERGGKPTTIDVDGFYYTTMNVLYSRDALDIFLTEIGLASKKEETPEWLSDLKILDDKEVEALVDSLTAEEKSVATKKSNALQRLAKNNEYKSILFSTGEQLVSVVFEILEEILGCSLKEFVDIKKEDFLIKLSSITFVGEIKGVGTNVKNAHVSQTDVHAQIYKDDLAERGVSEEVKSVLIINPFRTKPLLDREPVAEAQIELAQKHGCLIITTEVLLKLFEKFKRNELNCEQVILALRERSGLLNLD